MLRIAESELARSSHGMTLAGLHRALRRHRVNVTEEMLAFALQEEGRPRIVRISDMPERYALRRGSKQANPPEMVDAWERRHQDVILQLSDPALELLRVHVTGQDRVLQGRFDVVADGKPAVWFSMTALGPQLLRTLFETHPWTLSVGWKLPLRVVPFEGVEVPAPLVWPNSDPRSSAEHFVTIMRDVLGVKAERVRLDPEFCSPAEAERRVNGHRAVKQVRARRASGAFALATCLKCGQPLTHPVSLRYGVGPECRRFYSPEYFRAMENPQTHERLWFGAKKPRQWLRQIVEDLALALR